MQLDLKSKFKTIVGFADTLQFFRQSYPEMKGKYSLQNLHNCFIGSNFAAHDALADVTALINIMRHCRINLEEMDIFSSQWVEKNITYQRGVRERFETFTPLVRGKIITKGMAKKIARSGLELKHLKAAFYREHDGVRSILSEKFKNKSRVTNNKNIIDSIVAWLEINVKIKEE